MPSRITVCLMSNKSPNPNFSRQIWMLVFIGLIALPLNSLWVIDTGVTGHGINFTRVSLFMNAICVIFVLGLINPLLKRYAAKFSLTSRDMVLIYAMICVWGPRYHPALVSHHRIRILFRNSGEDWAQLFHRHIPEALVVTDRTVLLGYYKDRQPLYDNTFYIPEYVSVWVVPCLAWSSVILAVLVCMLGINLLVRKQWTIHEKLAYPLAQIPLDIISNGPRVFKTPLTSRLDWRTSCR